MSIIYCEKHDRRWDSDKLEECPLCENEPRQSDKDERSALAKLCADHAYYMDTYNDHFVGSTKAIARCLYDAAAALTATVPECGSMTPQQVWENFNVYLRPIDRADFLEQLRTINAAPQNRMGELPRNAPGNSSASSASSDDLPAVAAPTPRTGGEPTWGQLDATVRQHDLKTKSLMDTAELIWRLERELASSEANRAAGKRTQDKLIAAREKDLERLEIAERELAEAIEVQDDHQVLRMEYLDRAKKAEAELAAAVSTSGLSDERIAEIAYFGSYFLGPLNEDNARRWSHDGVQKAIKQALAESGVPSAKQDIPK